MSSPTSMSWHDLPIDAVLARCESTRDGLLTEDASSRLRRYGPNEIPQAADPAWWQIFLRQFLGTFIFILLVAAVVSLAIGEVKDALFIAAVLLLNAIIGGYQEWRASKSSRALQRLLRIEATVLRDGEFVVTDAAELVPGDVIWLESGARVAADARLLDGRGLETDESLLTGESTAVHKNADWMGDSKTPTADRQNMIFAGSVVLHGRSKAVVVETGARTVVGGLAVDVMGSAETAPPLLIRMESFSRTVAVVILGAVAVIGTLGVVLLDYPVSEMFLFGVALAVGAIPEGLPVALTVALSVATSRMAKRGVVVRRLTAVEGLGSCTYVASDKTGTLTCNELTVKKILLVDGSSYEIAGEGYRPIGEVIIPTARDTEPTRHALREVARIGVMSNEAELHRHDGEWVWRGDPTEVALLSMGRKLDLSHETLLEEEPQSNEIEFEPERAFAASFHGVGSETRVYVKGAPERVLTMCRESDRADGAAPWRAELERMTRGGYRVLAMADGWIEGEVDSSGTPPPPSELRLVGFVGMIDPLRPGARDAVRRTGEAGVRVAMVTGDHPNTALSIARDLGLASKPEDVRTGAQLEGMSPEELREQIGPIRVYARMAPKQKLEIVRAAQAAGHFVAVTGDGVNDAPALQAAHIGVAMGRSGTDVARDASELVITDDQFSTLTAGIEEGRVAYDNIRKVIFLLVSTGMAELILVCLALAAGLPLPLLPVQLLWLNLVTNGIQDVALAFEPGEGDVLRRRPRPPDEPIFNRLMVERVLLTAVVMGAVAFGAFDWLLRNGWPVDAARNAILFLMVLFENINIGNSRSETKSAFVLSPLRSPILLTGTILAFWVHMAMVYLPWGHHLLGTQPLSLVAIVSLLGCALSVLVVGELHKLWWARRRR